MNEITLPLVFTRRHALDAGWTRDQVERRVTTGTWRRLRRATYCLESTYQAADPRRQHTLETTAALTARGDDALASHLSAACLYGWPSPRRGWGPVTLTAPTGTGTGTASVRGRRGLVVQVAALREQDRACHRELALTSPARTLADILRHVEAPEAVAVADHALRARQVSYEQVAEVLRWQAGWPYADRGLAALQLSDPRRETWIESWSFVGMHGLGLALPEPQVDVLDSRGRFVARLDALWDLATAGEADGRVKYDLLGRYIAGASADSTAQELVSRAQRRLDQEKTRRDRVQDTGLEFVRWGAAEAVRDMPGLVRRINERRAVANPARFTGSFRFHPAPPWRPPQRPAG